MMHPAVKDRIATLRAEARKYRAHAKLKRERLAELRARPIGSKDLLAEMACKNDIKGLLLCARTSEDEARDLRSQVTVEARK